MRYIFFKIENNKYHNENNKKKFALAGSRTRISCLEGNYANRYTTNAYCLLNK